MLSLKWMSYFLYFIFGLLPALVWLSFYLRKDVHPEDNRQVGRIFLWGFFVALPVAFLEIGFLKILEILKLPHLSFSLFNSFLVVAFLEEFFKYLVVKEKVLSHSEFDEPIDAMLYMIIAALGFASAENILLILSPILIYQTPLPIIEIGEISLYRLLGATFLHTLASGSWGFFLALSFFEPRKRKFLFLSGLLLAVFLHGLYNFAIIFFRDGRRYLIPLLILIGSAIFTSRAFQRLKKIASVCKIK